MITISYNTLFNFYMYLFLILGLIFIIYAIIKSNQIKKFEGKRFINYYKEIPAYFSHFEERQYKKRLVSRQAHTLGHAVFCYELDGDEYIYIGKHLVNKYSNTHSYVKEEKITLYQDPKTGKVFESLCNSETEVKRFILTGTLLLVTSFFIFFLKYMA